MKHETNQAITTLRKIVAAFVKHRGYFKQAQDALHQIIADIEHLEKEKHDRPQPVRKRPRN